MDDSDIKKMLKQYELEFQMMLVREKALKESLEETERLVEMAINFMSGDTRTVHTRRALAHGLKQAKQLRGE